MRGYKFLSREFASETVAAGRFRLARLESFRAIEEVNVRDEFEGSARGRIESATIDGRPENAAFRERMSPQCLVGNGGRINFQNATFAVTLPSVFVLCLSLNPNCKKWLDDPAPKDAMIEVQNLKIVAGIIAQTHSNWIEAHSVGRVKYVQREFALDKENMGAADFFQKRPTFSDEEEVRMIFQPKLGAPKEFFTACPRAIPYLSWRLRER